MSPCESENASKRNRLLLCSSRSRTGHRHGRDRARCAASLAAYKVPTKWVTLPAIPRAQTAVAQEDLQRLIRAYRSPEDGVHD